MIRPLSTALALLAAGPLLAQVPADIVTAEVVPAGRSDDGAHLAGLRLSLAPGWKTYWRAPGDAGIPPLFDWSRSENLAGIGVGWPVPDVFYNNGMRSIGYHDEVILPLTIRPQAGAKDVRLSAGINLGVCNEICVPVSVSLSAVLPAGGATMPADVAAAFGDHPLSAARAGVSEVTCEVEPITDGVRLTASITMPALAAEEVGVVEMRDPSMWVSEPALSRRGDALTLVAEVVPPSGEPFFLARDDVRITLLGDGRAVDIQGCD